jgi:hypothetical protein
MSVTSSIGQSARVLGCLCWFLINVSHAEGALPCEAIPWTKSFLEARTVLQMEHLSLTTRRRHSHHTGHTHYDGCLYASASPLEDWECDIGLQGASLSTGKIFVRVERQLLSDLANDGVAVTGVVNGFLSRHQRTRNPVFFEMAQNGGEVGCGLGRHLYIGKKDYIQIFSYLMAGAGSASARWLRAEVGLQGVWALRHTIRCSYLWTGAFGHSGQYRGIGSMNTHVDSWSLSYAYRWDDGIEGRLSYIFRYVRSSFIRTSSAAQLSLSIPISL